MIASFLVLTALQSAAPASAATPTPPFAPLQSRNVWTPPPPPPPPAAIPPDQRIETRDVELGGKHYAVVVTGGKTVAISGGDGAVPKTPALVKTFGAAAAKATGCAIGAQSYWVDRTLNADLDCSARMIR